MSHPTTHPFDIDAFRVDPGELEFGDIIVAYSPPSQGDQPLCPNCFDELVPVAGGES